MRQTEKMSNAIGKIDERFVQEVIAYKTKSVVPRRIRRAALLVASLCLALGTAAFLYRGGKPSITVYARESDQELMNGKMVMMPGTISDSGEMKGYPLMFYVRGSGIKTIRFSCRNEWISFTDWTEQRENYGFSKNFTIPYGEREEDYYHLVVNWEPQNIIRKLTDDRDMKIADLAPEEKEDAIVMEVTYLDGKGETLIINITLDDEGQFMVSVGEYEITPSDDFVFRPDDLPVGYRAETDGIEAGQLSSGTATDIDAAGQPSSETTSGMAAENNETVTVTLSEEGLATVDQAIKEYYVSINRQVIDYVRADEEVAYLTTQEAYEGEVVAFRVFVAGSEAGRYILLGSQDGWEHCVVLNEGY